MRTITGMLTVSLLALSACAGYRIEANGQGPGYDVFTPEPYLMATPKVLEADGASALVYDFSIVWLPNYEKRYRVSSWAGLGKASFTFEFEDGWRLTKVTDESDNSGVLDQIVGLVKHVLPVDPFAIAKDAKTAAGDTAVTREIPRPVLYRIDFDDRGRASCLRPLDVKALPCPPGTSPVFPCSR